MNAKNGLLWKIARCYLLLAVQYRTVLCLLTYYMMERCPIHDVLIMDDFGISAARLRLTSENQLYRKDMLCIMSIQAPDDHMLMVRFLNMEIEGFMSEGCDTDYMIIYDGPDDQSPAIRVNPAVKQYIKTPESNRLCGTLTPRATFVTTGKVITFKFYSDRTREFRGFDLIFTSFHTGGCNAGEYNCKNGRCINSTLLCNDYNNCGDDSDWCGPNTTLVIFIVIICISVFVLLVSSVFRCACQEKVKRLTKSSSSGADGDLITAGAGMRVASFRGFSRRESTNSRESSSEPQQEPLLHESTSSV